MGFHRSIARFDGVAGDRWAWAPPSSRREATKECLQISVMSTKRTEPLNHNLTSQNLKTVILG